MINFVLRHNSTNLKGRYVAPFKVKGVTGKQEIMEEELSRENKILRNVIRSKLLEITGH